MLAQGKMQMELLIKSYKTKSKSGKVRLQILSHCIGIGKSSVDLNPRI